MVTGKFGSGKFGPGKFGPNEFGPGEFGPKYKCLISYVRSIHCMTYVFYKLKQT